MGGNKKLQVKGKKERSVERRRKQEGVLGRGKEERKVKEGKECKARDDRN